jgi:hypothetical protein
MKQSISYFVNDKNTMNYIYGTQNTPTESNLSTINNILHQENTANINVNAGFQSKTIHPSYVSAPITKPVVTTPIVKQILPMTKPVVSTPTPMTKPVVSTPAPITKQILPMTKPVVSTPMTKPVVSTPTPMTKPVVSTPTPMTKPVVPTPTPMTKPVVSTPTPTLMTKPVVSTPAPIIKQILPMTKPIISTPIQILKPVVSTPIQILKPVVSTPIQILKPVVSTPTQILKPTVTTPTQILKPTVTTPTQILKPTVTTPTQILKPTVTTPMTTSTFVPGPLITGPLITKPLVTTSPKPMAPILSNVAPTTTGSLHNPVLTTSTVAPPLFSGNIVELTIPTQNSNVGPPKYLVASDLEYRLPDVTTVLNPIIIKQKPTIIINENTIVKSVYGTDEKIKTELDKIDPKKLVSGRVSTENKGYTLEETKNHATLLGISVSQKRKKELNKEIIELAKKYGYEWNIEG